MCFNVCERGREYVFERETNVEHIQKGNQWSMYVCVCVYVNEFSACQAKLSFGLMQWSIRKVSASKTFFYQNEITLDRSS